VKKKKKARTDGLWGVAGEANGLYGSFTIAWFIPLE
jgi:hypothetical protein